MVAHTDSTVQKYVWTLLHCTDLNEIEHLPKKLKMIFKFMTLCVIGDAIIISVQMNDKENNKYPFL